MEIPAYQADRWAAQRSRSGVDATTFDERLKNEREARESLARILSGIALVAGLLITVNESQVTRSSTSRNFALVERGQVTDRFTRAVEQIGG